MIALSEKATRNKLEHLQNYLQENQLGSIEKKPRVGIWLNMDELCQKFNTRIIVVNNESLSPNEELVQDMIFILYGLR